MFAAFLASLIASVILLGAFDRIPNTKINKDVLYVLIMGSALGVGMAAPVLWWV